MSLKNQLQRWSNEYRELIKCWSWIKKTPIFYLGCLSCKWDDLDNIVWSMIHCNIVNQYETNRWIKPCLSLTKIKARLWILVQTQLLTLLFPWCRLGQHNWTGWTLPCWLSVTLPSTTHRVCRNNRRVFTTVTAFLWWWASDSLTEGVPKCSANGEKHLHLSACFMSFMHFYLA